MNKIGNFGIKMPCAERPGMHFFVIAKKSPRFKRVAIDGNLTPEQAQKIVEKYVGAKRLIQMIDGTQGVCETRISARSPFAQQLQALSHQSNLTFDGKKVTQVTVMSDEEYDDFTAGTIASVKQGIEELQKQNEAKVEESFVAPRTSAKAPKSGISFAGFQFLKKTQEAFNQMILSILTIMQQIERRVAERAKEAQDIKDKKRYLRKKDDRKADNLATSRLAQDINTQNLKTDQLRIQTRKA